MKLVRFVTGGRELFINPDHVIAVTQEYIHGKGHRPEHADIWLAVTDEGASLRFMVEMTPDDVADVLTFKGVSRG